MRKSELGFSHVIVLAVFVAVAVIGSGYLVYLHQHKSGTVITTTSTTKGSTATGSTSGAPSLAMPMNQANSASGVAATINSLATSLNTSEKSLYSQYNASDQTSDANVGTTATNVGGAYDASDY